MRRNISNKLFQANDSQNLDKQSDYYDSVAIANYNSIGSNSKKLDRNLNRSECNDSATGESFNSNQIGQKEARTPNYLVKKQKHSGGVSISQTGRKLLEKQNHSSKELPCVRASNESQSLSKLRKQSASPEKLEKSSGKKKLTEPASGILISRHQAIAIEKQSKKIMQAAALMHGPLLRPKILKPEISKVGAHKRGLPEHSSSKASVIPRLHAVQSHP